MRLYNDLTGKKEEFVPLSGQSVKIYVCGPTVYNYFHIGNARCFVVFDALRRYLEHRGYKVEFVQNFTDIDDKMIKRALQEDVSVRELADRYIAEYFKDACGLGVKKATVHPRATDCIGDIITLIGTLIEAGYAYESGGDVYFNTAEFKDYGKLSHMPIEELEAGARVEVSEVKKSPLDFALWKAWKEGEPYWDSPWGRGRPGWHIECSAMSSRFLGPTIDIHAGGQDLIFPHHENEIAQSEAANGVPFARYWLHNAYVNVDNAKMSKSKNNFFTVRDIAKEFDYPVMRFFLLSAHYRTPINFAKSIMEQAKAGLFRLENCLENIDFLLRTAVSGDLCEKESESIKRLGGFEKAFYDALDDDFNTADAIAALFEAAREINTAAPGASKEYLEKAREIFKKLAGVLGFFEKDDGCVLDEQINALIEERQAARAAKDFKKADGIRDKLKNMGIALDDTPQGVKWRRI